MAAYHDMDLRTEAFLREHGGLREEEMKVMFHEDLYSLLLDFLCIEFETQNEGEMGRFWNELFKLEEKHAIAFELDNDSGECEFTLDEALTYRVTSKDGIIHRRMWSHRLGIYSKSEPFPDQQKATEIYDRILAKSLGITK